MMRKQMSRRLRRYQLKKERILRNAFVAFMMKLFSLHIALSFLKGMFQKILFYFTVSLDILYKKFHDDHTGHIRSLPNVRGLLTTYRLLIYLYDVVKCKNLPL